MKVVCEYCDSYVEADENMKCPLCGAGLGTAVQAEQERVEEQEEAQYQREVEAKAQEAKESHISEVITGVANVATAFAAGAGLSSVLGNSSDDGDDDDDDDDDDRRPPEPPHGHRVPPSSEGGRDWIDPAGRGDHASHAHIGNASFRTEGSRPSGPGGGPGGHR